MKKKSLIVLLLAICIVCSIVLSSCSLISVNEERQANRIMATVTVDLVEEYGNEVKVLGNDWDYEVSLDITRRELISTVNYVINYYSQLYAQYGSAYNYDIEALLESSLDNMITQKYQTIAAMGELLVKANATGRLNALYCNTDEYQAIYGKTLVPEGVLTIAERYEAMSGVNDELQKALDDYIADGTDDEKDRETSEANNEISSLYLEGYFVDSVAIAKKVVDGETETFADGLYTSEVVDDANEETTDLKAEKVYVKVTLTKGEDSKVVYVPADATQITTANKEDADFVGKYVTVKTATVSFSGRQYAEVTEENGKGYEVISFTSEAVDYNLVAPRSKVVVDEEEDDVMETLRYVDKATWLDTANHTEEMKDLVRVMFNTNPEKYADNVEKDAYRQLRNMLAKNSVNFVPENPGEDSVEYVSYKYYNGLKYYYDAEFESAINRAIEHEVTLDVTVDATDVASEYEILVRKDKANYEKLSYKEQVKKFFETIKTDLSSVYYVPVEALANTTYEVDPTNKAYASLFTLDADDNVTAYNTKYVSEKDGKYYVSYAHLNDDGSYTIDMFYVAHILLSFDNVDGLSTAVKSIIADFDDEEKIMFIEKMVSFIKTNPQLKSYIDEYDEEKEYTGADVFGEAETAEQVIVNITAALNEAYAAGDYATYLEAFKVMMTVYNDDSGSLSGSGYLVSAGEMENGWYQDFTDTGLAVYYNLLTKYGKVIGSGNDSIASGDLTGNAFTDYGQHIMYVCFAPLQNVTVDTYGGIGIDTALDIEGKTWNETIEENLLSTAKTNKYNTWKSDISEETVESHTVRNEKNYNSLIDELKDAQ